MTDTSGNGRALRVPGRAQAVLAGGLAVLTAAVVTVVARTGDPASADTWVEVAHNAVVRLADGREQTARAGLRVPDGAEVRTGSGGGAQLRTAGRDVYVGALSTLAVRDGVHQRLDRGQVMVDSRKGPRLDLGTRAGEVRVPGGGVSRVETAATLRLGVFRGTSSLTPTGRRIITSVPALHQVQVPYGRPAGRTTALALTDDAWESRVAEELVSADQDLVRIARGLAGAEGGAVLTAAPVALRTAAPSLGSDRGEQALAVAVAQAARGDRPEDVLDQVRTDRADGGSWGVVAALVGARVTAVSALLDAVLAPPPGSTPPVLAGGLPALPGLALGGSAGGPGAGGGPSGGPTGVPQPSPTRTPQTTPPTSASPSPSPGVVDQLLNTVTGLLSPSPSPSAPAVAPSPTPAPLLTLGPIRIG